jgi:cell division protein FtsZ
MSEMDDIAELGQRALQIKVIGVGGAGNNAVDRLKMDNLESVCLANVNTDYKTLSASPISEQVMLGRGITRGLSAGGDAEVGKTVAEADFELIQGLVAGVDLVFLLVGLGGGTGSGAAPVVAQAAKEAGAVVITFATLPFSREGARRVKQAEEALVQLRECCDAVITLPNDLLLQEIDEESTVLDAFSLADEWIHRGVFAVWSMIFRSGLINVDFSTLRNAFTLRGGKTLFGMGQGNGENYVDEALRSLELCPLLHLPENRYVRKADSLIVHILGGPDLTMSKVNKVMDFVTDRFGSKDNTVLGAVIDGSMNGQIEIVVIGTTAVDTASNFKRYAPVPAASIPASKPAASALATPKTPPRPVEARRASPLPIETGPPVVEEDQRDPRPADILVTPSPQPAPKREVSKEGQNEFAFPGQEEERGHFEKTDKNLYEGEDLDVPTYLRRGIKITL